MMAAAPGNKSSMSRGDPHADQTKCGVGGKASPLNERCPVGGKIFSRGVTQLYMFTTTLASAALPRSQLFVHTNL